MRPFYRKDLFREDIIVSTPVQHQIKMDKDKMRLETIKMEKGQSITLNSEQFEIGIVVLAGYGILNTQDIEDCKIGQRKDVFSGTPTAIYIPKNTEYSITATGFGILELVLCKAKTEKDGTPFVVQPEEIEVSHKGFYGWKRKVHEIFSPINQNRSKHGLIIGESYGFPGQWATYPYEKDNRESILYFKVYPNPTKEVCVMTDVEDKNKYYVKNDTTLSIGAEYKPLSQPSECNIYYLWFKLI